MSEQALAIGGLATILLVLGSILTKRLSPLVALGGIPVVAALVMGFYASLGLFMLDGMMAVAPMAAMFLFAILFFAILSEAGIFEPVVSAVQRFAGERPARLALGTAIFASLAHLDGSGATTFLVVVPALLPIYDRLGLDRCMLACIVAMAAGVGNMLPWGGPTIRAATALDVPVMEFFLPVLPVYAVGLGAVLLLSWWIGIRQPARATGSPASPQSQDPSHPAQGPAVDLDWRYWINVFTVVAVLAVMLLEWLHPAPAFLLGLLVALMVNLPNPAVQREALERHAKAAVFMVALLLAAGVFTGILRGSGMLDALALAGAALMPDGGAQHVPLVTALLSMPASLLFDPDSFYFGILPVLGGVAEQGGVAAVDVGRAAILGQMSTGFPVSPLTPATFLLVGLAGVDLADHQRYSIPYLFLLTIIMTIAALMLGVIQP